VRPVATEQGWVLVEEPFSLCGAVPRTPGCVVDGDTLRLDARGSKPRRIRLTGFDAPEMDGACEAESALARQAREALLDWLDQGPFEWSGASTPPRDQYGRELRALRRTGPDGSREYVADSLVQAGLAGDSSWGGPAIDWCR
jgi:endonuclease YncB( thermonuclease family)